MTPPSDAEQTIEDIFIKIRPVYNHYTGILLLQAVLNDVVTSSRRVVECECAALGAPPAHPWEHVPELVYDQVRDTALTEARQRVAWKAGTPVPKTP